MIDAILWTPFALAGIFFGTWYAFKITMYAKRRLVEGQLTGLWRLLILVAIIGLVLDLFFNYTWGYIIYDGGPRGVLFSSTTQWYVDFASVSSDDYRTAVKWARRLNRVDPGHIKIALQESR